jgi:hypothetical protein
MFTLEYAKNPIWGNAEGTCIVINVKWAEFNEEHSFGATSFDPMQYGIDLYNRAKAGEFGEIAPYVDPMVATQPQPQTQGTQDL